MPRYGKNAPPARTEEKRLSLWIYATVIVAVAASYALLRSPSSVISEQFDSQQKIREWRIYGSGQAQVTADGLLIKPQNTTLLVSPELKKPRGNPLTWRNFPYVKVRVAPVNEERSMALIWIPGRDISKSYRLHFTVPAMTSEVVLDVRQDLPWKRHFGWDNQALSRVPIRHIGLQLQQATKIQQLEWLSGLGALQKGHLLWSQFWTLEPILPSSINVRYGNTVMGASLVTVFGIAFTALFVLMLVNRHEKFKRPLLWAMLLCFVAPNASFAITLWNQAKISSEVSAWHADRYDEYHSRFGREFAELDKQLLAQVPRKSHVAFPGSRRWLVSGETNWIWFLYYDLYENYHDRRSNSAHLDSNTEYVFYYYPARLSHDETSELLRRNQSKKAWKTQTVARLSEQAKILKLIHD